MTFIDRRQELAELNDFLRHPPSAARHRALVSLRRMGKSWLITEFRRLHAKAPLPYVDVEATDGKPEKLALRLTGAFVAEATGQRSKADVAAIEDILLLGSGRLAMSVLERIRAYVAGAAGRDPVDVLRDGLLLAEEILTSGRRHAVIFFDECQSWFAGPDEEPTPYEALFREFGDRSNTRFVFAGSASRIMDATFREAPEKAGRQRRPMHGRVRVIHIHSFDREDTRKLVNGIWRHRRAPVEAVGRVFALTRGHPAAATHLAERTASIAETTRRPISVSLVSEAFAVEVFERDGYLNAIAAADYGAATAQPGGVDTVKRIVDAVAQVGPQQATQARIAEVSGVKASNVVAPLDRLEDLDFVIRDAATRTYALANPIIGVWLQGRESWTPGAMTPVPPRILKILDEQLLRMSTEQGPAFESSARDIANRFDGRAVPGRLFGQTADIIVPKVVAASSSIEDVDQEGILGEKGKSVELDVFIAGPEVWLGEAKHRRHTVSAATMHKFWNKTEFFRRKHGFNIARRWFVSDAGFDAKAIDLARQHGILLTTARQLQQLGRLLRTPRLPEAASGPRRRAT